MIPYMKQANRIIRKIMWGLLILCILKVAISPIPLDFKISWQDFIINVFGLLFISFVMPLPLPKPSYQGKMINGDFLPLISNWAVLMFWLGLMSAVIFWGLFLRLVVGRQTLDFTPAIALSNSLWVWLVYTGKVPRWRSVDYVSQKTMVASATNND